MTTNQKAVGSTLCKKDEKRFQKLIKNIYLLENECQTSIQQDEAQGVFNIKNQYIRATHHMEISSYGKNPSKYGLEYGWVKLDQETFDLIIFLLKPDFDLLKAGLGREPEELVFFSLYFREMWKERLAS